MSQKRLCTVFFHGALGSFILPTTAFAAPPAPGGNPRDYSGPTEFPDPDATPPSAEGQPPPEGQPPAEGEPPAGGPPPVGPAPAPTPTPAEPTPTPIPVEPEPAPTQPEAPVEEPSDDGGDDEGDDGFMLEDLTDDEEAAAAELTPKTVEVEGASGILEGKVLDASSGEPLIGAKVKAQDTKYETKVGLDGTYELPLPPGTYTIRISADDFDALVVSNVAIEKDEAETLNRELTPMAGGIQVFEVVAEAPKETEGARLQQRKKATQSQDIMSRDEIEKSGGGSTSNVARRIVGATVIDGRFVFVRGLGHRYGNTLFDRARVPSPEPELRTIPLDIFPSGALSGITVIKTATPDIPADFAGGSTQLEARSVPEEFVFDVGAEIGVNTATTGRTMRTSKGFFGADAFGFGNLPRALPDVLPRDTKVQRGLLDDNFNPVWSDEDIRRFGNAFNLDTRAASATAPPNWSLKTTIGNGWETKKSGRLGFTVGLAYGNKHQSVRESLRIFAVRDDDMDPDTFENPDLDTETPQIDYTSLKTTYSVDWSALFAGGWKIDDNNDIKATVFYSRDAQDEAREFNGTAQRVLGDAYAKNTRLRYIMRSILFTRLGGEHVAPAAKDLEIDWFGSYSQARRDDPSMREMLFNTEADNPVDSDYFIVNANATQLFLDLVDHTESGALDMALPFKQWGQLDSKLKWGAWIEGKQREFLGRRFVFASTQGVPPPFGTGNVLIGNVGSGLPSEGLPFYINETTRDTESYEASQEVYAGYAMIDLPLVRWLRLVGGVRFEASNIETDPFSPFGDPIDPNYHARLEDRDWLPSVSLIFPVRNDMNVRISGYETLARPEFRELVPFRFLDFVGGIAVFGDPTLVSTRIWNADARWEWFPSASEVLAVSAFYKYFDDPIERVMNAQATQQSFRNVEVAHNIGGELEARKNLEFLAGSGKNATTDAEKERHSRAQSILADFSIGVNFAYTYSRVELGDLVQMCASIMDPTEQLRCSLDRSTSRSRPLQGQSPFVVNGWLSYDNEKTGTNTRLLYNVFGRRIHTVGSSGMPDVYEEPVHGLDFVLNQRVYDGFGMEFGVQNMLNSPVRLSQTTDIDGRVYTYRYLRGVTFTLGASYAF